MTRSGDETTGADARLRELVLEVLERIDLEGPEAVEALCREHPELADALRRRIAALAEVGLVEAERGGRLPESIGDFRLLEKLGAGGMGVVYRAQQISLEREVALKLIRPDALHLADARERFARETTIVAKLQHPGIVPIYLVGDDDELPYYAMELVAGCTLAEALAELGDRAPDTLTGADLWRAVRARGAGPDEAAARAPGALFAGSWEDTCLRVVGQVAEALQHAHGRGVLHRDLKPSNVMLTPSGRVMLLDFGLSQSEGAESMTRSGDRVGSLPYMPPELLSDGPRVLDRRSDVYALGVTLYQLLTLHLPFPGNSVPQVMTRILEGRPPRPRGHHPGLSWEGGTVCLAALDRDPARRYASADELARDLSNALYRRPVEARRASFSLRTRRWIERHPGEAAALLLVVLLPVVAAFLLAREARTVGAALAVAQDNRQRSLRAIDAMLVRLGDEALDDMPGVLLIRHEFLAEAADLYGELLAERPGDRDTVMLATRCDILEMHLLADEERHAECEELGRGALVRLAPWSVRTDPEARYLEARLLGEVNAALRGLEHHEEASSARRQSIEILRELVREEPDVAGLHDVRKFLLFSLSSLAAEARDTGEDAGGLATLRESVAGMRELAEIQPDALTRGVLADALNRLAYWLSSEGCHEESADVFAEELELRRALLDDNPRDEEQRFKVAGSFSNLAGRLIMQRRHEEALRLLDIASEEIDIVLRDFPGVANYEYGRADIEINRGAALGGLGRKAEALAAGKNAATILRELCDRFPERADFWRTLGTSLVNHVASQVELGDAALALETSSQARECFERALEIRPMAGDWNRWLAIERKTRALALLALERPGDAADAMIPAIEQAARHPDLVRDILKRLATCLNRARAGDDAEQRDLCEMAVREIVAIVVDLGTLDGDPALDDLLAGFGG